MESVNTCLGGSDDPDAPTLREEAREGARRSVERQQ
jgi:hypothetical protein